MLHVSSYRRRGGVHYICVLILHLSAYLILQMCPHTSYYICVLIPHTTYVSAYRRRLHSRLYVSSYYTRVRIQASYHVCVHIQTTYVSAYRLHTTYVSSYRLHTCPQTGFVLHTCPHTDYIRVRMQASASQPTCGPTSSSSTAAPLCAQSSKRREFTCRRWRSSCLRRSSASTCLVSATTT
jgi:hypothetical protein